MESNGWEWNDLMVTSVIHFVESDYVGRVGRSSVLKLVVIPTSNPKKWKRFRFATAHLKREAVASAL